MTLNDFFRILRHRKWWVVLAVALSIGGFLGRELTKPHLYRSSSQVLLNNQSAANLVGLQQSVSSDAADRFCGDAEVSCARARGRQARACRSRRRRVGAGLPRQLERGRGSNEDVLEFSVTARSRELAMKLATEYGRQFPIYRRELDTANLQQALGSAGAARPRPPVERNRLAALQEPQGTARSAEHARRAADHERAARPAG